MRELTLLPRAEEEAIRSAPACLCVMHQVGIAHPLEIFEPKKKAHREPLVHEPIVNDKIRKSKEGHPDADGKRTFASPARIGHAPEKNESHRDRRMKHRERVVRFESSSALLMMRSVNRPQCRVPDFAVQEARPVFHRRENRKRDTYPQNDFHASLR